MSPAKCPCCDGYGKRLRPPWEPGEGMLPCVSCAGTGLVWRWEFAPAITVTVPPAPPPDPANPYGVRIVPLVEWWRTALPTTTFTSGSLTIDDGTVRVSS